MNDSMNIEIVKLHDHPELIQDVVKILNLEWPRSESARIHSLKDSGDDLPCSLLLVHKYDNKNLAVIGHNKISKVHGNIKSVFIENVIVEKTKRGFGLGKKLMELTELYVSKLGYQDIYLSTHDKCKFYECLGYVYCSPVSPVRGNAKLLTPEQFSALQVHFGEQNEQDSKGDRELLPQQLQDEKHPLLQQPVRNKEVEIQRQNKNTSENSQKWMNEKPQSAEPPPPPPPPPHPPSLPVGKDSSSKYGSEKQFWMVKHLE
ncbi:uncharacterized protein LOC116296527 [Actinia tenebrosa]|uniref:Uncharacterized protein LOC116296527 n=1 Tax=Actinia tenebrosa TaxID=6105 RepID=A0A6P8I630_ACTTE|nr:uncharacterized protein LOC116296527 [Actinia tenebrosa]